MELKFMKIEFDMKLEFQKIEFHKKMPHKTRLCGTQICCNVLVEFNALEYHVRNTSQFPKHSHSQQ